MLETAVWVESHIGGGIAELPAALVAVDHIPADEPGVAEERVGFRNATGGERRADRPGAHRPSRVLEPRHDVDRKAELCPLRRKIIGGARAIEAKMKIEADRDAGDDETGEENAGNEVVRGEARERRVEAQYDRPAEPGRCQEPQLRALVGEAEQRPVGPKKPARMRLEGERGGRPGQRLGAR